MTQISNTLPTGIEAIQGDFRGKSIVSVHQFERPDLEQLFGEAQATAEYFGGEPSPGRGRGRLGMLTGVIMANTFYEPSTRTSSSFAASMLRLGGGLVPINDAAHFSSAIKGETLADTVRTLGTYADLLVLRHPQKGSALEAARASAVPVINAGDGDGEHPTQALLDVFTIMRERGKLDNLRVTMVGDLKNGRTVHSLAYLLAKYDVQLDYIAPEGLEMPEPLQRSLDAQGVRQREFRSFEAYGTANCAQTDIVYVTRVQKERLDDPADYDRLRGSYVVDQQLMKRFGTHMRLMHPLPRVDEISAAVDVDNRAAYFRQVENGIYIRMALIASIFGRSMRQYIHEHPKSN